MRKLLLLVCFTLIYNFSALAGNSSEPTIQFADKISANASDLQARPHTMLWVEIDLPMIKDAAKLEIELDYDDRILKLERVSDQKNGPDEPAGFQRKDDRLTVILNGKKEMKLFVGFKVISKGRTAISFDRAEVSTRQGQAIILSRGADLPVITNIEDSSWSRLKAIFND